MSYIFNFENFEQTPSINNQPYTPEQYNYNSKIYFKDNEIAPPYELYSGSTKADVCVSNYTSYIMEGTAISRAFFNKQNLDFIQNKIREKIFMISNGEYNITRQSDTELQIIMRSIFLSNSVGNNEKIKEQLDYLNKLVIDECVRIILPEIKQYLHYREDIRKPRHIISHPVNPSIKGSKTYALTQF